MKASVSSPFCTSLHSTVRWLAFLLAFTSGLSPGVAQEARFNGLLKLTNQEMVLRFNAPSGVNYRIDAITNLPPSTNAPAWNGFLTLQSSGFNQHTDSAAPYLPGRIYRAEQLPSTNVLTGDHLNTTNGDVVIHPVNHASFVMSWNGRTIYNDPVGGAARYAGLPRADLILVSHSHGDHYDAATLTAVRGTSGVIVVPSAVYNQGSFAALRPFAAILSYTATTNLFGMNIEAVAGYNGNHAFGMNNCYVLTVGGRRIFTSGDTGDTPEIRGLTNIDVAFLCMNMPFTMNASTATNLIRALRPKVVYPYHYSESQGAILTNAATFKQWLGSDLGIEVRLRKWY